jgi:hypothetical protein
MKNAMTAVLMFAMVGLSACATTRTSSQQSETASQKLILEDQQAIEKADRKYKDTVLKNGESSNEAVKAKTNLDNAKNKLAADEMHVQQLQKIHASEAAASDGSAAPAASQTDMSGRTTTTTTVTTTPSQQQ